MRSCVQTLRENVPPSASVYCAHEYTAANAKFALSVDPENEQLQVNEVSVVVYVPGLNAAHVPDVQRRAKNIEQLRRHDKPTIPFTMEEELKTNPFLRAHDQRIRLNLGMAGDDYSDADVFAALRARKDHF